jgi:photosystem II stability/assembly factor-like uncharacterized protein
MQSEEIPLSLALDMAFKSTDVGWIVGEYEDEGMFHASVIETIDGGKTWENVWIDGEQGTILNSIHYCDDLCIAVGNDGLVVKREGSDSFKKISSFTNQNLVKVHLSDAQHGWIIGEEGHKFFKTENSGENWSELSDFNNIVNDLYFIDASHGWAVGCDTDGRGLILKTGNGGESWDVQVEDLSASLITIEIKDEYIWAAGEEGLILKSDVTSDIWIDERTKKIYPTKYRLSQNYPNPFNPSTTIEFDLPKASNVMIEVYNIAGQKVQTLLNENIAVGNHQVEFNAEYLSSGVYFYKIAAGEFQDVKKMILLR